MAVPRILAVDWGERRIGLAVSDPFGLIATGLATLEVRGEDRAVSLVAEVAREHEVARIVVGLPLLMSGERGEAAQEAQRFADALAARTGVQVETYDERLTSALSERRLREVGVRVGHSKARVDQGAAVALLESYLSRLRTRAGESEER
jgi:putative Holliday junction resolvase